MAGSAVRSETMTDHPLTEVELLPCPFCGGEAKLHPTLWGLQPQISCECGGKFWAYTEAQAIAAWNTRSSLQPSTELHCASTEGTDMTRSSLEPIAVPPDKAFAMIGVGVTKGYELINAGEFDVFKIGRATRITVASVRAYVARQLAGQA